MFYCLCLAVCTLTLVLAIFFGSVSSGKANKSKNKQMGLHQTKELCKVKETINKMKKHLTEWEKIFSNSIFDKELVSKMYKELIQLNIKKQTT